MHMLSFEIVLIVMFSLTVNPRLATNPALSSLWEKTCKGSVSSLLFVTCNYRATSVAVLLEVFFAFLLHGSVCPSAFPLTNRSFLLQEADYQRVIL